MLNSMYSDVQVRSGQNSQPTGMSKPSRSKPSRSKLKGLLLGFLLPIAFIMNPIGMLFVIPVLYLAVQYLTVESPYEGNGVPSRDDIEREQMPKVHLPLEDPASSAAAGQQGQWQRSTQRASLEQEDRAVEAQAQRVANLRAVESPSRPDMPVASTDENLTPRQRTLLSAGREQTRVQVAEARARQQQEYDAATAQQMQQQGQQLILGNQQENIRDRIAILQAKHTVVVAEIDEARIRDSDEDVLQAERRAIEGQISQLELEQSALQARAEQRSTSSVADIRQPQGVAHSSVLASSDAELPEGIRIEIQALLAN